jgi:hypothetical protein
MRLPYPGNLGARNDKKRCAWISSGQLQKPRVTGKFLHVSPLKIGKERGVMKIMEITPFIPLTLRGSLKGILI